MLRLGGNLFLEIILDLHFNDSENIFPKQTPIHKSIIEGDKTNKQSNTMLHCTEFEVFVLMNVFSHVRKHKAI